jgi:cephalosporin hydroxylase/lipopolysaccharide biosynthesis glycosyltransferase
MISVVIVTAADSKYFPYLQGTISSIIDKPESKDFEIGFLDLGCTAEQIFWLSERVNSIVEPIWDYQFPSISSAPTYLRGLLARPFLSRYFPGYDIYVWIDADAWIQDWAAVEYFIQGALNKGFAIAPELDRGSMLMYGEKASHFRKWVIQEYEKTFGSDVANKLCDYPVLNAGVFAGHHNAPHWQIWDQCLGEALLKSCTVMTDQFSLNYAIYLNGLFDKTELLPAYCNWCCHYGLPKWDSTQSLLVEPYLPHSPIGILHFTFRDKDTNIFTIETTNGKAVDAKISYIPNGNRILGDRYDYVSPNLDSIDLDQCFPNKTIGNVYASKWPYLRNKVPHLWYIDRRFQQIGFVSKDESHILYNTSKYFQGEKALEIGCWVGWSTCHLAAGGVDLDVIDPILENTKILETVTDSLRCAGYLDKVNLYPGSSPEAVNYLANEYKRKWSLIFIDGNHDHPGPLIDAQVACRYAEPDCLILFHDLASPAVAEGLHYLRDQGWNVMIYLTMQIMGVAWRGNVSPVYHQPDPKIQWTLPEHLRGYPISGEIQVAYERSWETALPSHLISSIQKGSLQYTYKGIRTVKNPFDLALYPQLIWQVKPRTIIEIGSFRGGSALWLGDMVTAFNLDTHIYSVDVNLVTGINHPRVTYLSGSGRELDKVFSSKFIEKLPRPLLVIEDADYQHETSLKVLDFFHQYLLPDEYIIVEDGIVSNMGEDSLYNGGPGRAIRDFLETNSHSYQIDTRYCDFYGKNLTWCINGFLRKITHHQSLEDREFQSLLIKIKPYTLLSEARLYSLYSLAKQICQEDKPGHFVECGVYKGGSSALLAWVIKHYDHQNRKVYSFDTFEGMPDPTDLDKHDGTPANDTGYGVGTLQAPIAENLEKICRELDVWEYVVPVKGLFEDTLPEIKDRISRISLLHADGDWYKSTLDILDNLYTQLCIDGGI